MAITIPRGKQTQTRLPFNYFLQIAERNRLPLETIGNAINNLGQTILDAENEKQKIRLQNDLINAETELNREVFKRSNKLFQDGYDYSPSTIKMKAEENIKFVDKFISEKFKNNSEALKYTDKLRFGAYQLFEKNLYENSNKRLQLDTISTHEDKLQSTLDIIENGKIGPGMWTNYHGTQKKELRTTRKNAEKYGGSFDQEKEEYALELLIMKKALGKQSSVNPITGEPEIDYTGIIQNLNNPEYKDIFGETITTTQRKDLRAWAKKGQTDANASTSNFIKIENAKAFKLASNIDNKDISPLEKAFQIGGLKFYGKEGDDTKQAIIQDLEKEFRDGPLSPQIGLNRDFVEGLILDGKIGTISEKVISNPAIIEQFRARDILKIGKGRVSLADMMREGLLNRKDILPGGQLNQLIDDVKTNPQRVAQFKLFIDSRLPIILGSKTNKFPNDKAETRAANFQALMRQRFQEGISNKIPFRDLLDPKNKNYIYIEEGKFTNQGGYNPTIEDITTEAIQGAGIPEKIDYSKKIKELKKIIKQKKINDNLTRKQVLELDEYKEKEKLEQEQAKQ